MYELITYSCSVVFLDCFLYSFNLNRLISWYILHAFCNFFVVYKCIPYILFFINEPLKSIQDNTDLDLHYYAVVPHIYHCIAFDLNKDDIFHHVLFVFFGMIFKHFTNTGFTLALYLFFINGVPGGIDYIMLTLYKLNFIDKHTRHKIAVYLNSWVRCPGLIFSNTLFIFYTLIHETNFSRKMFNIFISLIIWSYNGLYYNYQVRDTYIKTYQMKQLQN